MFRRSSLLLLATVTFWQPALAQQPQALSFDPNAVLATLKDLKAKQQTMVNQEKSGVAASINAAIADPGKYYELATVAVEFQGGTGNDASRINEWRKRNAAMLRNPDVLGALRQHLIYVGLSWQHSTGAKTKDQLGALLDYLAQLSKFGPVYAPFDITRKSLGESVFVTYFQIGPYINGMKDWSDRPFDADSIYEKTIFPELRNEKSLRLLDCWRDRIQSETTQASTAQNSLTANRFNNITLPTLLWNRAEDELALGLLNQAVNDMLAQIKAHPDHPDFDKWTARLTEIVAPPKGEVTVGTPTMVTPAQ